MRSNCSKAVRCFPRRLGERGGGRKNMHHAPSVLQAAKEESKDEGRSLRAKGSHRTRAASTGRRASRVSHVPLAWRLQKGQPNPSTTVNSKLLMKNWLHSREVIGMLFSRYQAPIDLSRCSSQEGCEMGNGIPYSHRRGGNLRQPRGWTAPACPCSGSRPLLISGDAEEARSGSAPARWGSCRTSSAAGAQGSFRGTRRNQGSAARDRDEGRSRS